MFIVAFLQIRNERVERKRRAAEERAQQRRDQAQHISAWVARDYYPSPNAWLAVLNGSAEPIYEVVASIVNAQTGGHEDEALHTPRPFRGLLSIVPAGQYYVGVSGGYHGMSFHPGVVAAFTDRGGVHWLRYANGRLKEIPKSAIEYYGLGRPSGWHLPLHSIPEEETS